jgi:hypothetical protein
MSETNVIAFPGATTADTEPETVLHTAVGARLAEVVVLGWREDGSLFLATSSSDPRSVLWLIKNGEHELFDLVRENATV